MAGLSILSGAHLVLVPRVIQCLREQGLDDVLVLVGGSSPRMAYRRSAKQGCTAYSVPARRRDRSSTSSSSASSTRRRSPVRRRSSLDPEALVHDVLRGDRRAAARLMTLVENEAPEIGCAYYSTRRPTMRTSMA